MRTHAIKFDKSTAMTKQSFKDECDINKIMAKFQKTGALNHYAKNAPQYGDATGIELQDALNVVANANTMFEELPATIRKKFENDPAKFLDFVNDEKNADEMVELGLREGKTQSEITSPQPKPPETDGNSEVMKGEAGAEPGGV